MKVGDVGRESGLVIPMVMIGPEPERPDGHSHFDEQQVGVAGKGPDSQAVMGMIKRT